jgi:hypothetical protein
VFGFQTQALITIRILLVQRLKARVLRRAQSCNIVWPECIGPQQFTLLLPSAFRLA